MRKYILKHKFWLITTVFFRSFGALMQVFVSLLIQQVIDKATNKDMNGFVKVIIFGMVYFCIMGINDYLNKTTQFIYVKKTLSNLKEDVFRGILRKGYKDFNSENTAEYISSLTNDINMLETKYIIPYLEMIGDVIIFVTTVTVMIWINFWITLFVFLTGIVLFLVPVIWGKKIEKRQRAVSEELSKFTNKIKDIFLGYEVIKSYNIEDNMTNEFLASNNKVENLKFRSNHLQGISEALSIFIGITAQVCAIGIGGYFLIKGRLTVGTLFAIVNLANGICGPIIWIVNKMTMIRGMKSVNNKLIKISNENKKVERNKSLDSFNKEIKLKDIDFSYDNDRNILNKLSVSFEKNKKYAIVGRSGSGKSTLLKILLGYYNDYKGDIFFDGEHYNNLDNNSILNQMSVIHQNVYMFDKTLKENILLGKKFNNEELNKALNTSGVNEFVMTLPNGINSFIGENGNNLSGGQRQRVAIARSLIQNTPILLLDEGTSALDSKTAFEIEDTLLNIDDLTVITITHKLIDNILSRYDEIIVMNNGKIVEQGSFNELMDKQGEFYELYSVEGDAV